MNCPIFHPSAVISVKLTLANRISQFPETSVETPILAIQNAQYNPMDPIPQTDSIHQMEYFHSFSPITCDIHSEIIQLPATVYAEIEKAIFLIFMKLEIVLILLVTFRYRALRRFPCRTEESHEPVQ
ncbi:hypothetical protein CEXT_441841 [Caerostris extrusa]|uniref:Uncharacterized protein n=1 Tax=Caerostris extrusa TaxID=172846 RepID=A0AAV4VJP8_CAEEX|nr:hypothetical protein CEXT_441841 [Caerostris extrusa]